MIDDGQTSLFRELVKYNKEREAPNYITLAGFLALFACIFYELALHEAFIRAELDYITLPVHVFANVARIFLVLATALFWYRSLEDRNKERQVVG